MVRATVSTTFESWRSRARELLQQRVPPEEIAWLGEHETASLFQEEPATYQAQTVAANHPVRVPADFLKLAASVCAHTDPHRWSILYRLLYRLTHGGERHLLHLPADPDTRQCQVWAKAVGRDIHKMHAFVRFRLVGVDETTGREQFVSWFEPAFRIVRLAAPFFEKRFAGMDWCILTPDECVFWDGRRLGFTPGMRREDAPQADAHDDLWRTYYRSIFNPARVKVQAMKSEMPQKYWKNLPEAQIISGLISGSQSRVHDMLETPLRPVKPMPDNAYLRALHARKEPDATGCTPE